MKYLRYLAVLLIGVFAIGALYLFEHYSSDLFQTRNQIFYQLHQLQVLENQIDFEVLKSSLYLQRKSDELPRLRKKLNQNLQNSRELITQLFDVKIIEIFERYQELILKKLKQIEDFEKYNTIIKRSASTILSYLDKLHDHDYHLLHDYEQLIIDIVSGVISTKSQLDATHLSQLREKMQELQTMRVQHKTLYQDKQKLLKHLRTFIQNFPHYKKSLDGILNTPTKKELDRLTIQIHRYFDEQIQNIHTIFQAIILIYILALVLILLFIYRLDRENHRYKTLQEKLAQQVLTDDLTKLANRQAYKKDVRQVKRPFFALIDIDGFKHYNDFYGIAMGDHILRESAKILKKAVPAHYQARFYRVGADEFGVLIDEELPIQDETFAQEIIKTFAKTPITFKKISLTLSVSVALTRKRPLLETADLVMKLIKKERRFKYLTYKDDLGLMQEIKENVKRSGIIKAAIENDRLIPFFQPIIDNKSLSIKKYEVLARIKHEHGIESIHPYLAVAKEIGLYDAITKQITQKAVEIAHKHKKEISLNISMNDIENSEFLNFLGQLFKTYPGIAKQLSFEILESETLKDYEAVKNFISIVKAQGSKVGIDDFGKGYSNFTHIFNLDIDFIKIDGSLIQEIDHNKTARLLVTHIASIAHALGIKTVAEFIPNKKIFDLVIKIGIDCSQGYFLGEPKPLN